MKKLLAAVATATALLVSAPALAADILAEEPIVVVEPPPMWYVGVFAGAAWTPDFTGQMCGCDWDFTTDTGFALGVVVGTKVWDAMRVEVELSGTSNDISGVYSEFYNTTFDGDSVDAVYLMGNLWYDFYVGNGFTPYVGGGIGVAWVSTGIDDFTPDLWELDGSGFAYQLGAGVRFDVAQNVGLDLGYRFKAVPGLDIDDDWGNTLEDIDLSSHVFQVGLNFAF